MKYDLTEESLLRGISEWKWYANNVPHQSWIQAFGSFEEKMAYAPRNKFFSSEAEQRSSMSNRLAFLHVLEKRAKVSGNFRLADEFVKDFVERND